jgi:hypothetical protein
MILSGTASAINPPITVASVQYSLAVRFNSHPENEQTDTTIVSGIIDAIESLGGGRYRIVCRRAPVPHSEVASTGGAEDVWLTTMGGNIAHTGEHQRPYNWLADDSCRGDLSIRRAIERDMLWGGEPGRRSGFMIEEATPFGFSPIGGVRWQGDNPLPYITYSAINIGTIAIEPPEQPLAIDHSVDILADAGVYIEQAASPGNFTKLTRKVFNRPDGTPDADLFPVGATLLSGEFWRNTANQIILASLNASIGTNARAIWYETGLTNFTRQDGIAYFLRDEVAVYKTQRGPINEPVNVVPIGGVYSGTGAFVIEFPTEQIYFEVRFTGGSITGVWRKDAPNDPFVLDEALSIAFAPPFDGVIFNFEADQDELVILRGASPIYTVALTGFTGVELKRVGIRCETGSTIWYAINGEQAAFGPGAVIQRREQFFLGIAYFRDVELPSGNAIQEIKSTTNAVVYTRSDANPRRRGYWQRIDADTIRIYSESTLDNVRIQQAADASLPSGIGRAPRATPGTINYVSFGGDATDANKNKWNWHDVLIIRGPSAPTFGVGDSFEVKRNCCIDTREAWHFEFDEKNEASDWAAMDSGDYIGRPEEGVFLIAKSFVDGLASLPCFRIRGVLVGHQANLDARKINELNEAVEVLGDLYTRPGPGFGGVSESIAGTMDPAQVVPEELIVDDASCLLRVDGLILGTVRERHEGYANLLATNGGGGYPAVVEDFSTGQPGLAVVDVTNPEASGFTTASNTAVITEPCSVPPFTAGYNRRGLGTTARRIIVWPSWGLVPPSFPLGNFFGVQPPIVPPDLDIRPLEDPVAFRFNGVNFGIPPQLQRAPKGSIITAKAEILFSGLSVRTWSLTERFSYVRLGTGPVDDYTDRELTINGGVVAVIKSAFTTGGDAVIETYAAPDDATAGDVSFQLLGKSKNSRNITPQIIDPMVYPRQIAVPDGIYTGWGGGITGGASVESGKTTVVDISAAMAGFLNARESTDTEFQLFPSVAPAVDSTPGSLAGLLLGLDATRTLSFEPMPGYTDSAYVVQYDRSGRFVQFDGISFGNVVINIKPPDGVLETFVVPPIPREPMF